MKVILFGGSGMVGQGVLRECLLDPGVSEVLSVARSAGGPAHDRLATLVRPDLSDLSPVASELAGYDACFFCLGVSSSGMDEASYRRLTYDLTVDAARLLSAQNPSMTFVYVSGAGTDSTEKGRTMWARVKGATENALLKLPFRAAYMFRPGLIRPLHGIRSRTTSYRVAYAVMTPFFPLAEALLPNQMTTTERVGQAMLAVAEGGAPKAVLEARDINALAKARRSRG